MISCIHLTQSGSDATSKYGAYVKFSNIDDVEHAVKRSNKKDNIRIYRTSNEQMQLCFKSGFKYPSSHSSKSQHDSQPSNNDSSKSLSSCKILRVLGLPWSADVEFVINMFPGKEKEKMAKLWMETSFIPILFSGLEIDRKHGVQLERDHKKRNNGNALIEFKNASECDIALSANLREYGQ